MKKAFFVVLLVGLATVCVVRASSQKNGKPATPPGQAKKEDKAKGPKSKGRSTSRVRGRLVANEPRCLEALGSGDSVSKTKLTGWFRIHVVGTGKKCLVKEKDKTKTEKEQFGEFATSEAFIQFFGEPECEGTCSSEFNN